VELEAYFDRLWYNLALSLTLGGVLVILVQEFARSYGTSPPVWLLATTIIVVVVSVPAREAWAMSADDRIDVIARLGDRRLSKRMLLYYSAFHVHKAFWVSLKRSHGDSPSKMKPPRYNYPRLLAEALFSPLNFRGADALLSFLRFSPEHFKGEIDAYRDALKQVALDDKTPNGQTSTNVWTRTPADSLRTIADGNDERARTAARARSRMRKLIAQLSPGRNARLLWPGYEIVTTSGTGAAVGRLQEVVREMVSGGNSEQDLRDLLDLVDHARAHSLIDLAGLRQWHGDGCKGDPPLPQHGAVSGAAHEVARNFVRLIKARRAGIRIVTSGYSDCVLKCLDELGSARIKRVSIVEIDRYHRRDNLLMSAKLEQLEINTHIIDQKEFERQSQRTLPPGGFDIAIFGFEVMSINGDVLHPRSTPHPLGVLASANPRAAIVAAVGERWKVREIDIDVHDPSFVAVYNAQGLTHLVTDHEAHAVPGELPIRCCLSGPAAEN
jgi:hypothetical protein